MSDPALVVNSYLFHIGKAEIVNFLKNLITTIKKYHLNSVCDESSFQGFRVTSAYLCLAIQNKILCGIFSQYSEKMKKKTEGPNPGVLANVFFFFFFFFFSFAYCPSKQFFSHVGKEPQHPGYINKYFLEVNVSCSRTQQSDLSEDRNLTSLLSPAL